MGIHDPRAVLIATDTDPLLLLLLLFIAWHFSSTFYVHQIVTFTYPRQLMADLRYSLNPVA